MLPPKRTALRHFAGHRKCTSRNAGRKRNMKFRSAFYCNYIVFFICNYDAKMMCF